MALARTVVVVIAMLLPAATMANGPHAQVGCTGCHGVPGAKPIDPAAKKQDLRSSAFCLDCHEVPSAPLHASHPMGLALVDRTPAGATPTGSPTARPTAADPKAVAETKAVKVPQDLLRSGRFECQSCHDPHPTNSNHAYLRVDVGPKGEHQDRLCAVCHADKPRVETK